MYIFCYCVATYVHMYMYIAQAVEEFTITPTLLHAITVASHLILLCTSAASYSALSYALE